MKWVIWVQIPDKIILSSFHTTVFGKGMNLFFFWVTRSVWNSIGLSSLGNQSGRRTIRIGIYSFSHLKIWDVSLQSQVAKIWSAEGHVELKVQDNLRGHDWIVCRDTGRISCWVILPFVEQTFCLDKAKVYKYLLLFYLMCVSSK